MGWERRGNGQYYYRKRRKGRRVVSEYIGAGLLAEAIMNLDELERVERTLERERVRAEIEEDRAIVAEVDRLGDLVRAATQAVLLTAGYHTHKGQWRRRRE